MTLRVKKASSLPFDRELDDRVNKSKRDELHAYGLTCHWIVISPVEAQALLAGVVSAQIQRQVAILLSEIS